MIKRILNYSNRNPWLYAVYVVVVGLPLVLIVTFCCSGSKPVPKPEHPKKTDAVQEDDEENEAEEEEEAEEEAEGDDGEEAELIPEEPTEQRTSPRQRRKVRKD